MGINVTPVIITVACFGELDHHQGERIITPVLVKILKADIYSSCIAILSKIVFVSLNSLFASLKFIPQMCSLILSRFCVGKRFRYLKCIIKTCLTFNI